MHDDVTPGQLVSVVTIVIVPQLVWNMAWPPSSGCTERGGVGISAARAGGIWQPASPARHTAAVIAKIEILIASSPVVAVGAASLPARNGEPEVPAVTVSLHDRSHGTAPPALR
jgi:hypothetical protein